MTIKETAQEMAQQVDAAFEAEDYAATLAARAECEERTNSLLRTVYPVLREAIK